MNKRTFSLSIIAAAVMAFSSTAFATNEVDPAHDGKHEKWVEPGNGPGNGYGHFKDNSNNGNGNNGGNGGNGGSGGNGGAGGQGGNASQLQGQAQGQSQAQGQQQGQGQAQQATGIGTGISNSSLNANLSSKSEADALSLSTSSAKTGDSISGASAQGGNAAGGNASAVGGSATGGTSSAMGGAGGESKSASTAEGGKGGESKAASSAANGNQSMTGSTGNTVSVNNVDQSQSRYVAFMDAPALPATFGTAGIQARKVSECGPRYRITPFERDADVPFLALPFISFNRSVPIQTEHGMNSGFNTDKPFELIEFPVPGSDAKFRVVMGHVLYMTTGHDSRGGATTGGANYAGTNAVGVAGGSSANNAYGVFGYVAVPCVFTPEKPAPAPVVVPPVCLKANGKPCVKTELVPAKTLVPAN